MNGSKGYCRSIFASTTVSQVRQKKCDYTTSLRNLERISDSIHEQRSIGGISNASSARRERGTVVHDVVCVVQCEKRQKGQRAPDAPAFTPRRLQEHWPSPRLPARRPTSPRRRPPMTPITLRRTIRYGSGGREWAIEE